MNQNLYPHLFQPLTIRGVTLKNRLEYAPTVVLKCNADGTVGQDMDEMKAHYADCALRCKHAGFRMVMIHCAHQNFLAQWLSPASNVWTDEYGGSPENRRRYPLEVLKAVREAVGEDMVIEMRVSAVEGIPGGMEFDESLAFMKEAQEYVDIVHVSQGSIFHLSARYCIPTYFREPHKPLNVDYAAEVKKHLHVPVAVVGMITTLEQAEEIIASGKADIVAMAKSFMADGDIVRKSLKGQQKEIRPCTRCDLCGNANTWGTNMSCAINPRCGVSGQIQPVLENERKKVMVIGGGPAGMMAAQTLVQRGHSVKLYEKSDRLGGLLNDACLVPFKTLMREYLDWDIRETGKCGAEILLNTEVTEDLIEKENPDAIIVATGSVYVQPPISGIENALSVRAVDAHEVEIGENVVVCGGGITGLECALALAKEGKCVTVVDQLKREDFIMEMPIFNKADLLDQLENLNVALIGGQRIQAVKDEVETVDTVTGEKHFYLADSVVNALGVKPDDSLGKALLAKYGSADVILVGDCTARGGTYYRANHEAYYAAKSQQTYCAAGGRNRCAVV